MIFLLLTPTHGRITATNCKFTSKSNEINTLTSLGYDGCIASCTASTTCTHWAHYNSTCHLFKDDLLGYQINITGSECGYDAKCTTSPKCDNSFSNLDIDNNLLYIPGNNQARSFPIGIVIGIVAAVLATVGISFWLFKRNKVVEQPIQLEKRDTIKFTSNHDSGSDESLKNVEIRTSPESREFPHPQQTIYIHNSELNNQPRLPIYTESSTINSIQPPLLLNQNGPERVTLRSTSEIPDEQPPILLTH